MSTVSPKTVAARAEIERILTRLTVNLISMFEAKHQLWKLLNDLTDKYDEGYNHGWKAHEEEVLRQREVK